MLQFKKPVAACDRPFVFACPSAPSGRRFRAVLVTRPVGPRVGGGPIGVGVAEVFGDRRWRTVYLPDLLMLRSRSELDRRHRKQGRTGNRKDRLSQNASYRLAASEADAFGAY